MERTARRLLDPACLPGAFAAAIATLIAVLLSVPSITLQGAPPDAARHVSDFTLADTAGANHTAAEWRRSKAVVLFFIGSECPVSNAYSPDMQQLAGQYAARGVACYGVHADPSMTAQLAANHAKEYGLAFPILLDPELVLAQQTGAQVTPEAVVLSPDGRVLYRGRIDDRYATDGKRRDVPTTHDLAAALDAVLAGKSPAENQTKAFGCPLPKVKLPKAKSPR